MQRSMYISTGQGYAHRGPIPSLTPSLVSKDTSNAVHSDLLGSFMD